MRPTAISMMILALLPRLAAAQTLRVDVEAEGVLPAAPVEATIAVDDGEVPVVVVVPVDGPVEETAERPQLPAPPSPAPPPRAIVAPAPEEEPEEELQGWVAFGGWAEGLELSSLDFDLSSPEVSALAGTRIGPGQGLGNSTVGGVMFGFGMRAEGILRMPELRVLIGGGDTGGSWTRVDGSSLEVQTRGVFVIQLEAAAGLQVELGPVVPYVLGRASIGGAFLDVNVRDDRLGELGTEHPDALLLQAGIEAGVEVRAGDGLAISGAFRGSFAGTPSYGGVVTLGFVGE